MWCMQQNYILSLTLGAVSGEMVNWTLLRRGNVATFGQFFNVFSYTFCCCWQICIGCELVFWCVFLFYEGKCWVKPYYFMQNEGCVNTSQLLTLTGSCNVNCLATTSIHPGFQHFNTYWFMQSEWSSYHLSTSQFLSGSLKLCSLYVKTVKRRENALRGKTRDLFYFCSWRHAKTSSLF